VIVVGAGVMGSATAWWLARWGLDVALMEQYLPGHHRGSSHGSTRIFRLAYPEPSYVHMAQQALLLWHELEAEVGVSLLETTGGIDYGETGSVQMVAGTLARAAVQHEILGPDEAARNWPGFVFDGPVVHQPDAGRIAADRTVQAFQADARKRGAQLHFNEPIRVLDPQGRERIVVTSDRGQYRAKVAVVTAGAWAGEVLAGLVDLPELRVSREQVFHFPSRIDTAAWPSYIHHGSSFVYGLAAPGDEGVKVAEHHAGTITTADSRSFDIDEGGRHRVLEYVARQMPGLEPAPRSEATCLYTTTPDHSFVVERQGPIVVGSVCSGHGFKFAPLIGRQLASLACSSN
jgi:monomeric sarcosine oxidase